MKNLLLAVIIIVGAAHQSSSQNIDALETCFSDDAFVEGLVGCFLTKFEDLLGGMGITTLQTADTYSGRKLQEFRHLDDVMRKKIAIPRALENFQKTHKDFINQMSIVGHLAKQKHRDAAMMKVLKDVNLKSELEKYMTALARNLLPVRARLNLMTSTAFQHANSKVKDVKIEEVNDETIDFLCDLLPELCPVLKIGLCLDNQPEESYEDGLDWLHCVFECPDIPGISSCMLDLFNSTSECTQVNWIADIIIRGFVEFVGLGQCAFEIVSPDTEPVVLTEGQPGTAIEFITYMPPGAMCYGPNIIDNPLSTIVDIVALLFGFDNSCDVQVQISTNMYMYDALPFIDIDALGIVVKVGRPKCNIQDMMAVNQIAVGFDEHAHVNASGVIHMTNTNWNSTFRIPVTAVVDHKLDGNVDLNFTLKYVVEGETHYTRKVLMTAVDTDAQESSVCGSINDPHITTFDGHYYNNLYHGYFYLYKHTSLPYQVQVIQQACDENTPESCTCAVAVQSGDDVFVVDKCRRTAGSCSGASCHPYRALFYTNGDVTPNTRVIRKYGGLGYDVILPHGQVVSISGSRDLLNVWVKSSTFDRNATVGLCGMFNEKKEDDLLMPDGTVYTGTGSTIRGQPRPFNTAWRVLEEDRIFAGVAPAEEEFVPESYCRCTHVLFEGVTCDCHGGNQVETCDMNLGGELTEDKMNSMIRSSLRHANGSLATVGNTIEMDDIDIDENYVPEELSWRPGYISESQALAFCNDLLDNNMYNNEIIRQCTANLGTNLLANARFACQEDIQITNNTLWKFSALDDGKKKCLDSFLHSLDWSDAELYARFVNSTCINDCNMNGECLNGECYCNSGFTGADCSVPATASVSVFTDRSALCDRRTENCYFATVYGENFRDDSSVRCIVTEATADSNGVRVTGSRSTEVDVVYISSGQVACRLPGNGSYSIDVTWGGKSLVSAFSNTFHFISYDSVCYSCDAGTNVCTPHNNAQYCVIGGGCYDHYERSPADDCKVCNVTHSVNEWAEHTEPRCVALRVQVEEDREAWERDRRIRIGVACGLSALVVIIVIIIYVVHRKKEQKKLKNPKPDVNSINSIQPEKQAEHIYEEPNTNANNAGPSYDNAVLNFEEEKEQYPDLRVEAIVSAAERRAGTPQSQRSSRAGTPRLGGRAPRERTTSTGSIRSIGIGGGAPNPTSPREPNIGHMGGSLSNKSGQTEDSYELIARF